MSSDWLLKPSHRSPPWQACRTQLSTNAEKVLGAPISCRLLWNHPVSLSAPFHWFSRLTWQAHLPELFSLEACGAPGQSCFAILLGLRSWSSSGSRSRSGWLALLLRFRLQAKVLLRAPVAKVPLTQVAHLRVLVQLASWQPLASQTAAAA